MCAMVMGLKSKSNIGLTRGPEIRLGAPWLLLTPICSRIISNVRYVRYIGDVVWFIMESYIL